MARAVTGKHGIQGAAVLAAFLLCGACSPANFSAGGSKPQPAVASSTAPSSASDANPDVGESACLSKILPVRVVFALDVSSSMTPDLRGVDQNVAAFASRLSSLRFEGASPGQVPVELGMVAFTDNLVRRVELTAPASFAAQIAGLGVFEDPNTDLPEAGLAAVGEAARMLDGAARARGEGISVVVVVTDAMAHDGSGVSRVRRCDVAALDGIKAMSVAPRFAIYDASPEITMVSVADRVALRRVPVTDVDPTIASCNPYSGLTGSGPAREWADLRERLFQGRKGSGAPLGFPFNAQALLGKLPGDLETTYRVCK
ncbi:VWA domain-containing protein [bacterium]|nr:VWA domain-containing protein [bacterium]